MKKILTILAVLLFSGIAYANEGLGFIRSGETYRVVANNRSITGAVSIPAQYRQNDASPYMPVTRIAIGAFKGRTALTSVTIPASVTIIDVEAFRGCTALTSVAIPDSVTIIGWAAFEGTALTSITIPDSVTRIGRNAFTNTGIWNNAPDNSIVYVDNWVVGVKGTISGSINIPGNVRGIASGAFRGQTGITSVIIPNSVTAISGSMFEGCTSLTSVTIPAGVTSIGYGAFDDTGIFNNAPNNSVVYTGNWAVGVKGTIRGSINIPSGVRGIADCTFNEQTAITSVTIPNSVTTIGDDAFSHCIALTSVTIPNSVTYIGSGAFEECMRLASITMSNNVTTIGSLAFRGCAVLTAINIPNSVTSIGENAFDVCARLVITVDPENASFSSENGALYNKDKTTLIAWPGATGNVTANRFASTTITIGNHAFTRAAITGVTIPDSVKTIVYNAFIGCSRLTSVTIGSGVETVGQNAFGGSGLTSITIPGNVTTIQDEAFKGCARLTSVTVLGNTNIGEEAFMECPALRTVTIEGGIIGKLAFAALNLTSLTFGNGVTVIGELAFTLNRRLTTVNMSRAAALVTIGSGAFDRCFALTSITIPNSVTTIDGGAFNECTALTSVTIPNSVTTIGNCAFMDCTALATITIPASVTTIGEAVFRNCHRLVITVDQANRAFSSENGGLYNKAKTTLIAWPSATGNVTIPNSVTTIGDEAFWGAALTGITISNSVTTIENVAFKDCTRLTTITIPNSVTTIGNYAFSGCTALRSVTVQRERPPALGQDVLLRTHASLQIHVPAANVAAYRAAARWRDHASRIVAIP